MKCPSRNSEARSRTLRPVPEGAHQLARAVAAPGSGAGFTLIELIGVLAVVSILAAVLIPRVFEAISNARVHSTALSITTLKTTCVQHVAKFGSIPVDGSLCPPEVIVLNGSDSRAYSFDTVLMAEQLLDKPFSTAIGSGFVQVVPGLLPDAEVTGDNAAYALDGASSRNSAAGSSILEVVITDVLLEDARALNRVIDGAGKEVSENPGGEDLGGSLKYAKPAKAGGPAKTGARQKGSGNGNGNGNGNGQQGSDEGNHYAYGRHREGTVDVHVYLMHR